ncbi:MAG: hypothetical protein H0V17_19915 [Deltaproteobacteria bacterium]|nr:hypothetical protein [Deltaproteobacteria bacterium]
MIEMYGWGLLGLVACSYSPTPAASPGSDAPSLDGALEPGPGLVRELDLDDAQVSGGPHTDFPLLVSLTETWLRDRDNGGDVSLPDALDVIFTSDQSGTIRLAHEIEIYRPDTGTLIAWVRIPALTATSQLFVHYGDPEQQSAPGTVFAGEYELVLHLSSGVDVTEQSAAFSIAELELMPGQIDRGVQFDGTTDRVNVGSVAPIDNLFDAGGTAEGWFFATSYGENGFGRLFDKGHTGGWSMAINNGNAVQTLAFVHGGNDFGEWNGPSNAVTLNAWHHAAVVYDKSSNANQPVMYIDGVALTGIDELVAPGGAMDSDAAFDLAIGNSIANDRTFDGILDELRLASVPRDASWIGTQFKNQSAPGSFVTPSEPL